MENGLENTIYKGTKFWTNEIERAGLTEKLRHFNDVVTENRPPAQNSYGEPVLTDVILDGKKCDIYHTDHEEGDNWHRIFIHIKQ